MPRGQNIVTEVKVSQCAKKSVERYEKTIRSYVCCSVCCNRYLRDKYPALSIG